jgi:hypothetical protein
LLLLSTVVKRCFVLLVRAVVAATAVAAGGVDIVVDIVC